MKGGQVQVIFPKPPISTCFNVPQSLSFQAADELYMDCLRSVDPEDLRKPCAKYIYKIVRDQNAVAGASAHVFRACKPEIKVRR